VGPTIDVWSLGVVFFGIVTGKLPFDADNFDGVCGKVIAGKFVVPFFMALECEHLIRGMLCRSMSKRFTIAKIKQHGWLEYSKFSPPQGPVVTPPADRPRPRHLFLRGSVGKEVLRIAGHKRRPRSNTMVGGTGAADGAPGGGASGASGGGAQKKRRPRAFTWMGRGASNEASSGGGAAGAGQVGAGGAERDCEPLVGLASAKARIFATKGARTAPKTVSMASTAISEHGELTDAAAHAVAAAR
jgi:hypothetical protein